MRSFFKSELETLYAKTQLRQYETLSAMPDAPKQIAAMLDALVRVCSYYPYIPDKAKQSIIQDRMLKDEDFIGFNAKIVSKWMEQAKGSYFKESCHIKEPDAPGTPYDALSPDVKKQVDDFIAKLATASNGFKSVPEVSQKEIDDLKMEDLEEREGKKAISTGYQTNPEIAAMKEKKFQWMRECFDPITGKPTENYLTFDEWIRMDKTAANH